MPFLQKFADVHLIVGYLSSVILPILGFVGACIVVRYKGDYTHCMVENHYVKENAAMKPLMAPIYEAYNKTGVMNYETTYESVLDPIQYRNFTLWMSSQKSDRMKFWLRTHEGLTFGFSISFFLFI